VVPDMVIGTDGGGWALMHLHACFRLGTSPPLKLACALSAAIPSRCSELPILPIGDGSLWQTMALNALGIPSVLVPQRGTVTASALELAFSLGTGCVFLAGMDLSIGDIRTHARPYGFDHLFLGTASRLRPVYSQAFARSGDIRAGGSHNVYAAWFKSRLGSWQGRVFSLGGKHGVFENVPSIAPFAKKGKRGHGEHFKKLPAEGLPAERCGRAVEALTAALKGSKHSAALVSELAPLLFPSRSGVSAEELAVALQGIAGRYLGECRG